MNTENNFTVLTCNEMEEVNGGVGPVFWTCVGLGVFLVISAGVSAFNGYQEAKWSDR